jgi:hypothetical protein
MMVAKIIEIFRNPKASPVFSFLIGMGFAVMLFHKPIETKAVLSLPVSDVESQIVRHGQKCYMYRAEDSQCEIQSKR